MNETTITKLLAITAVIFVAATLISLPYQNQVANAAPAGKKYQVYITLTDVPDNAGALYLNLTLNRALASSAETTVSSPVDGQTLKFVLTVASGNAQSLIVYAEQVANPDASNTLFQQYTGKVNGPIRVDFAYPSWTTALATEPATEEQALATDEEVATEEATDEAATDEEEVATTEEEEEEEQALATDEGDTTTADTAEQPIQQSDEGGAAEEDTGGDIGRGPPTGGGDDGGGGRPLPDDSGGGDDSGEGDS